MESQCNARYSVIYFLAISRSNPATVKCMQNPLTCILRYDYCQLKRFPSGILGIVSHPPYSAGILQPACMLSYRTVLQGY